MTLTEDQKIFILERWNKTDFLSLVRGVFKNVKLSGRSPEAKLVQKYLGNRQLKQKNGKATEIILTDSQKEYIRNNVNSITPFEIGKIIFDNPKLEPLSKPVLVINEYIKSLGEDTKIFPHENYASGDYRPPDQLSAVVTKINIYLRKHLSLKTMPTIQKKTIEAIRDFLHAPRFLQTINSYTIEKTREMFEGEFIRTVFDKPDLTPDELNVAITLCQNYVNEVSLNRQRDMLNVKYEEVMNDPDGKLTMTLSDMIKAKSEELDKCHKLQERLVTFLSGQRSKRQDKQIGSQQSIARLVEWFRDENDRKRMDKLAQSQLEEDETEVERLMSVSEVKAKILGLSKSELTKG